MSNYEYIIVGAGISGLFAAYQLKKLNKNFILFERKGRIGGRIKSVSYKGITYDTGAVRIAKNHKMVLKLIKELGLEKDLVEFNPEVTYNIRNKVTKSNKEMDKVISELKKIKKSYKINNTFIGLSYFCVNHVIVQDAIAKTGYDAEMHNMNCYDYLLTEQVYNQKFYRMKNGLSQIIYKLAELIGTDNIKTKSEITDIMYARNTFQVTINNKKYSCKKLILALPKKALLNITGLDKYHTLLSSVSEAKYVRVYAIYPVKNGKSWFSGLGQVNTDLPIRKFIPIDEKKGLVEICYCDYTYANILNDANISGKAYQFIENNLKKLFPKKEIPKPLYVKTHYWNVGCHWWLPHVNSSKVRKQILQPDQNKPMYIVGEAYSNQQGWIEGALQTVKNMFSIMSNNKKNSIKKYKKSEVSKHNTEKDAWISYNGRVYDITKWISKHPGGSVIKIVLGKDMTSVFDAVGHSESAKNILEKYFIGKLI